MPTTVQYLQQWLDALKQSTHELTQTTLGLQGCTTISRQDSLPWQNTVGAYVPCINHEHKIQLGLVTTPEGCNLLARTLLGLSEEDPLEEEDKVDAIREIVNILGGMCKTKIGGNASASSMGLPIFINGYVQLTKEQSSASELVALGDLHCYLIVIQGQ